MTSLHHGNKISDLNLLWSGYVYEELSISVDIAICFEDHIAKHDRHSEAVEAYYVPNSFKSRGNAQKAVRELPGHVRHGYILAKAVRCDAIAAPQNPDAFDLTETIKVDDVITSYMIKSALFNEQAVREDMLQSDTPVKVCVLLYRCLLWALRERKIPESYIGESPLDCTSCQVERGCCKRRKLVMAVVEKTLQWLHVNQRQLEDVDFADVGFFENLPEDDSRQRFREIPQMCDIVAADEPEQENVPYVVYY